MTTMTQCRLQRGNEYQVAWIETKFARKGKPIKIKVDGEWDDGWTVARVGSTLDQKTVEARERDYRSHRRATDV